jgi:hypothetical protein
MLPMPSPEIRLVVMAKWNIADHLNIAGTYIVHVAGCNLIFIASWPLGCSLGPTLISLLLVSNGL